MKNEIFKFDLNKKKIYILLFLYFSTIKFGKRLEYLKPKVSVFLPIYNKYLYLKRSIDSILKQSLRNLEIIAVNDFSSDNSLKILKKLSKKDNRIKIINNDRNHGLLYSRAMGILNCTGEYLLNLDPDDMIPNIHNLEILYKIAKKNKTDLIIFKLKLIRIYKINISELYKINKKYNLNNRWNYHEDHIWSSLITKYSKSKILLNEYMYLYIMNRESLMRNLGNILQFKNKIYRFEMFQKIYNNNLYIFNIFLKSINKNGDIIKRDIRIKKKFIYIFVNIIIYYKINKYPFFKNIISKISNNRIVNSLKYLQTFSKI